MNRIAAIFIALMFAWPLEAQGGSESEVPPASGPNKEQLPEVKPDSGNIVRNDRVLSRLGFDLRIGGTLEFEFKRTQREEDQGVFSAPSRAHYGLDLDKASLTLSAMLRSNVHANVEFEFDEDDAQLDEGYVTFINPLTGIELIPRLSDDVHDNLLIGLEDPFWRNTKRVSESYSLLQNSLARDERMQAIYTVTLFDFAYVIAGVSNGASLALDGSVDETENYPILQDDRGAHFAGFDDDDQISRRIETVLGAGVAFDLASGYSASVFPKNAAFRPMDLQRLHKDFAHFGVWFTSDRLSDNERTLLAGLQGADATSQKWRLGGIAEMVLDLDGAVLGARFEYAHAADGRLKRNFWSLDTSVTWPIAYFIDSMTPFARYSSLRGNRDGALVTGAAIQAVIDTALMTADRAQFTMGMSLELAQEIKLIFEFTHNDESFHVAAPLSSRVDNDLYLLALHIGW